jgi:diphosphomevalonate decarboxylase
MAYTMQALVKYHGLKDWKLRIPYHDSISVNTTSMLTDATITDERKGGVYIDGKSNASANTRLSEVVRRLRPKTDVSDFRIDSGNVPGGRPKGIGYSASAGAALTMLTHRLLVGGKPDTKELSRVARLFAASAARSLVGGFSRLYAGKDDEGSYAEKFADEKAMDLRMVIVPLSSRLRTEDAHREVMTSPFFEARLVSAQKRCDEMEEAILGNDLGRLGVLAEMDTMELHGLTMTGENRMMIMTADTLRIMEKVRQLRGEGVEAYFSTQTGPSVFINTSEEFEERVLHSVRRLGYRAYLSRVGGEARVL